MNYNYQIQYLNQQKIYRIYAVIFTIFLFPFVCVGIAFFNTLDYLSSLRTKTK